MKNFLTHKIRTKSPLEIFGIIIFGIVAITALAILLGYIVMSLWNWLMPELFGLPALTYWQAVGLFILLKILLGGCGGKGRKSSSECNDNKHKNNKENVKTDFSKWKHYDQFWEEEGDELYKKFIERQANQSNESND